MKPRHFTLDLALDNTDPPQRDEYLRGPNVVYRVLDSRPVDSRIWDNRWHLTVVRVGQTNDLAFLATLRGKKVHPYSSYRKGETPAEYFAKLERRAS